MSKVRVFAYGSNLSEGRMTARLPTAKVVAKGSLEGHTLAWNKVAKDGSGKANVVATQERGQQVPGVIYEIDPAELKKLDGFEQNYDRRELVIQTPEGPVRAFVYVAQPQVVSDGLKPYAWYKRHVVEGAKQQGLPPTYVNWLELTEAVDDPDAARDERERAVTP